MKKEEVVCVIGQNKKTCFVATKDIAGTKTYLRLYTKDGIEWIRTQSGERAARRGEALCIHRENIFAVCPSPKAVSIARKAISAHLLEEAALISA